MKIIKQIILIITLIYLVPVFSQQIVGYAPYYRTYGSNFDFGKFTHVHFFAIYPNKDGELAWPQNQDSISMYNKYLTVYERSKAKGTKVILTFGGTAEVGSKYFSTMAKDEISRSNFVRNAINICKNWNADGIDIDWETNTRPLPQEDLDAYTNLMIDLRTAVDQNNLSLSVDVSSSAWFGINTPSQGVDQAHYINVMTYSYNGAWSTTAKHHSDITTSINTGMNYWINQGISKSKLNIGVSFYGVRYKGASSPEEPFNSTDFLTYSAIESLINSGYTVIENNENGTYCYSNTANEIVFYDSPLNAANKMDQMISNGYGGVIIWEIGQDNAQQSLATAIKNGVDDNQLPIANANGPYNGNVGSSIAFSSSGSIDPDGLIVSFLWDFGDGNSSTIADPSHSYNASGSYRVTLTVTDNSSTAVTTTTTVTISDPDGCNVRDYVENGGYSAGSQVQNNSVIYECKPFPYSGWCNGSSWAYAPGSGTYWTMAWNSIGPCLGSEVINTTFYKTFTYKLFNDQSSNNKILEIIINTLSSTSITLYNQSGQLVLAKSIYEGKLAPGNYRFLINSSINSSGLFFLKIKINNQEEIIKILKS